MKNKFYVVVVCLLAVVLLLSSCFRVVPDTSTTPAAEQPTETTVSTPVTTPTTTPAPPLVSTTPSITPSSPAPTIDPSPTKPPSERALIAFTRYNNATWEERIYTVRNDGTDLKN